MATPPRRARTSRERYRSFVTDYRAGRLDEQTTARAGGLLAALPAAAVPDADAKARRWLYARAYLRWLWPHRRGALLVFALALGAAGLDMVSTLARPTLAGTASG